MSGSIPIEKQSTNINYKLCRSRNLVEYYTETLQSPPTGYDKYHCRAWIIHFNCFFGLVYSIFYL
ncbi:hypothetical protein NEPAR04_1471 [Nematocida parisii]|nr:hypothetical protein NEPAR04_1471 [Nematocida parisii]